MVTDKQEYELYLAKPILEELDLERDTVSSDKPDLVIMKDDRRIGAEIVSCYPDEEGEGSYNSLDKRIYNVCRKYAEKHKRNSPRRGLGFISFSDAAYTLDKTVSTHQFEKTVFDEIDRQLSCSQYSTFKYVERVSFHDVKGSNFVEFIPIRVGYCETMDSKFVLACIEKKEKKLEEYKRLPKNRDIGEYWLLICIPMDTFRDLDGFKSPLFQTSYDRVYISDLSRVIRLK